MQAYRKTIMIKYLLVSALILSPPVFAQVKESPVPGGIKKIAIESKTKPILKYNQSRVAVIKKNNRFIAIIGIPLNIELKTQTIHQTYPYQQSYTFEVKPKHYKVQKLTIANTRKVTPLKADQARITQERTDLNNTLSIWRNNGQPFNKKLIAPVRGYITSTYGLKRIYNKIPKAPHTALDIAAPLGTPVKATADGQVINLHNRFYTGNTIIIDHGQGLISLYAHLNSFKVKNGQFVKQGDIIGTVGKTGRVTGPHLHWALYLNQTSVDPLLFLDRSEILPKRIKPQKK